MSITAAELAQVGKAGLDFYLKNNPIDMVDMQRPLLKHLSAKKKPFAGAKEIRCNTPSAIRWSRAASRGMSSMTVWR